MEISHSRLSPMLPNRKGLLLRWRRCRSPCLLFQVLLAEVLVLAILVDVCGIPVIEIPLVFVIAGHVELFLAEALDVGVEHENVGHLAVCDADRIPARG